MQPKTKREAEQMALVSDEMAAKYLRDADGCRPNEAGRKLAARFTGWAREAEENSKRLRALMATLPD